MENMNPLTQDQLKEMTGKWVRIVLLDESNTTGFAFVTINGINTFFGYNCDKYCVEARFTFDECGKEFEAYSLEEKHIDPDKWDYCESCKPDCYNCLYQDAWDSHGKPDRCKKCVNFSNFVADENFCEKCGRPRTEQAWEELEQRLIGCK